MKTNRKKTAKKPIRSLVVAAALIGAGLGVLVNSAISAAFLTLPFMAVAVALEIPFRTALLWFSVSSLFVGSIVSGVNLITMIAEDRPKP
jgi:hypothetical protein